MRRIEAREDRFPRGQRAGVGLWSEACGVKFAEQVVGGGVGEADVGAGEVLVEDGSAKKARELLFFGDFPGKSEDVSASSEDRAVDAAVQGREENELAFVEGDFGVAAAESEVMGGLDLINGRRIEAQIVEGVVEIVSGASGGWGGERGRRCGDAG